jgi:hypothetical protein
MTHQERHQPFVSHRIEPAWCFSLHIQENKRVVIGDNLFKGVWCQHHYSTIHHNCLIVMLDAKAIAATVTVVVVVVDSIPNKRDDYHGQHYHKDRTDHTHHFQASNKQQRKEATTEVTIK